VILFLIIISFVASNSSADLLINEVMNNPIPNDNYNEWIELFNPTSKPINISDWSVEDNSAEDYLFGDSDNGNGTTIIPAYGYAIIADHGTKIYENFSIPSDTISLYVDDLSIGNSLGNSKDKVILKNGTGSFIDAIEWGYDYFDIPGNPVSKVKEGSSIARYHNIDTNDSENDFYEGIIPTPGSENIFIHEPNLDIELYPLYIPKIQNNSDCSLPFAIKVNMSYYNPEESYKLKAFVVGDYYSNWPATQTWNGNRWEFSNFFTSTIKTDENGNWSGWQYIRLNNKYKEYKNNIKEKNSAYLKVKISGNNITDDISKEVYLLDIDNSTSNGTKGGYAIGISQKNNYFLEGKLTILENKSGKITGIYITENNEIDEKLISRPGYYKLTSPVDSGYDLKFIETNGNVIYKIEGLTITHGRYGVEIYSNVTSYKVRKSEFLDVRLRLKNIGDFNDSIIINIENNADGWSTLLEKDKLNLRPKETDYINLRIKPYKEHGLVTGDIKVLATSEGDIGENDEIIISLELIAPDLVIKNIKLYNEIGEECNTFGEGEIVKIKAFYRNIGNENATNSIVYFYCDSINEEKFIGSKYYESIGKYQKYPQIKWDTKDILPGNHRIIVIADNEDKIDEQNDYNNKLIFDIEVINTRPSNTSRNILITDIYYHSRPGLFNEFISIYNPTSEHINLSGWYLTNEPFEIKTEQTKLKFPDNVILLAKTKLVLSEKAMTFKWETGKDPDFEYNYDTDEKIPQMNSSKKFIMSNKGDAVALKDKYNHTIDFITYGKKGYKTSFWKGEPIPFSGEGAILVRCKDKNGTIIDTNTSNDWLNQRRYGIGQSDFPYENYSFNGEISTFVSPDCSYQAIVNELRYANESIYLNIYEFTNPFLCEELIDALLRNVTVNIFLEGSPIGGITDEEKYILRRIANYGGSIRFIVSDPENDVYARYVFNHGKYLIIDNKTIIIESCNWGKTGVPKNPSYGNREWGIIVKDEDITRYYLDVFLDDWDKERCDVYKIEEMNMSISPYFFMDDSISWGFYKPQFSPHTFKGNFSAIPILSPDTSNIAICDMIKSSKESIYIEQLYIYKDWNNRTNPFVKNLVEKAKSGVDVKVILNYNPNYESTNDKINITKQYFEKNGIDVKLIYTNWSYFSNVHNKGLIIDNKSVLVSSINWNENSVTRNREVGIIINNFDVANYYKNIFFYDWNLTEPIIKKQKEEIENIDYKNTIYIIAIYTMTFALIARDWRKRQWT
jgi:phosphatidylserine/phosphatidylglycerophosphate/cardiolipin synthase-like enzyme